MASGLPLVLKNDPVYSNAMDGSASMFDADDELASTVNSLLRDKEKMKAMSGKSTRHAAEYSCEEFAEKVEDYYRFAISDFAVQGR